MKKRPARKLNPLAIEKQEVVEQVHTKSIELVRLSRVKYEGNDLTFVDLRVFQRGFDDQGEEIYHPTRRGLHIQERDFLKLVEAYFAAAATGPLPGGQIH
jgi:hypothetical protein